LACATTDDVWDLHTQKMCEYGFDRLLFLSTNLRTHGEWGDISDTLVLSTYPQEVVDVFVDGGLYKKASIVPRKDHKPAFHSWRNFMKRKAAGDLTEAEIELSGLHAKWKIAAGYTIWFDETSNRNRSVVGLCARQGLNKMMSIRSGLNKAKRFSSSTLSFTLRCYSSLALGNIQA
jgi:hypothetical protein